MTYEEAFFILRHGSAEGEHKYFEAISLIEEEMNRQKAEVERLRGWENLLKAESHALIIKKAKAEAVKEFADRLEPLKKFRSCMAESEYEFCVTMREVDAVKKEMVCAER